MILVIHIVLNIGDTLSNVDLTIVLGLTFYYSNFNLPF